MSIFEGLARPSATLAEDASVGPGSRYFWKLWLKRLLQAVEAVEGGGFVAFG